jgi:hypothetical protein
VFQESQTLQEPREAILASLVDIAQADAETDRHFAPAEVPQAG